MEPSKKELILAVAVFLALPIVAELALRVARVPFDAQLYGPDRELGWVLRPGASGLVSTETPQFVHINSHGFRDRERTYEKPANTFRIAILGNSWTEALQLPLDQTYPAVLEKILNQHNCLAGRRVEILNFGVAGYSTAQELLLLKEKVWSYHPDFVILALYPARDIANNVRELNNAVTPERSPYFLVRGDQLVLDDSFQAQPALQPAQIRLQSAGLWFDGHFRILQAINTLQRHAKIHVAMAAAKQRAENAGMDNLEFAIYAPPSFPDMQEAWKVTEHLLVAMRDEVRNHGAHFCLVTLATRPQVIPDAAKRAELLKELGVADFSYADRRIAAFAARSSIEVVPLAPALSAYAESHHAYLNGFRPANFGTGHWNQIGHRLAAETIAASLCTAVGKE
ncbi:MAG TPA: SGNH/GDSL hydrolase family protein [Candidatus Eisenbacteria bacterium]|nr:SGNH/GDSL hydrolase family protein [Candidatus Eisenbacteria bacterium]